MPELQTILTYKVWHANDGEGQALALRGRRGRFSTKKLSRYRSAGACPPRVSGRPQHGEGQALALR